MTDYAALGITPDYLDYRDEPTTISDAVANQLADIITRDPAKAQRDADVIVLVEGESDRIQWQGATTIQLTTETGDSYALIPPFVVPASLPFGYHHLRDENERNALLIYAPLESYQPKEIEQDHQKLWGAAIQLYTLRSDNNWGIGDFADLKNFTKGAVEQGMATIGLNPLHLLYNEDARKISPYSPSSRVLLNPLYIAVHQVPEFQQYVDHANAPWNDVALEQLRATEMVDYPAVTAVKFAALRATYQAFEQQGSLERKQAFEAFCQESGPLLYNNCLYQALYDYFYQQDENYWGWVVWPEEYHNPASPAVAAFAREHQKSVRYYQFLQWLAELQLAEAQQVAKDGGMPIGLYCDLAVGTDKAGAESWLNQNAFCIEVSVGCPPDAMAPKGQGWGLLPFHPQRLIAQQYKPFIELVQSNMRSCGALRLDHVMALYRLWWIPEGETPDKGGYVQYPVRELIAILTLESRRNRCLLIGEDLGTVPAAMGEYLSKAKIFSYKVQMFERNPGGGFKHPHQYFDHALAVVSTHDLPPLLGFWRGNGVKLREERDLYPDAAMVQQAWQETKADHDFIRAALREVLHAELPEEDDPLFEKALVWLMHEYLALSQSALMVVQPEDFLLMDSSVNLPGTCHEHPNWQRKLTASVDAFYQDPWRQKLFACLRDARAKVSS